MTIIDKGKTPVGRLVEPVGSESLTNRATESILASIFANRFADGRLPPEGDLAVMLGVSRTTVRAALQSLEQHGVLTRRPGRGTQVRGQMSPATVALQRLISFSRLLAEQGHEVHTNLSLTITSSVPEDVADALGLAPGANCHQIDNLLFASGEPAVWAINYYPSALVTGGSNVELLASSPFEMGLVGGPIEHALVELVPQLSTPEVQERLGLKPGEAYLMLRELHFSVDGVVLGFSHIHVNDRFVRFQLHRGGVGL
jgi:GntR family transcriptional regulator